MTPRREPPTPETLRFSRGVMRFLLRGGTFSGGIDLDPADMRFTAQEEFNITLVLDTGKSKKFVLLPPSEHQLSFEVSGSQTSLEKFRKELSSKESTLFYDVSQEYSPGQGPVPADELLKKAAGLKQLGITIKSIKPKAIDLNLDKLLTIKDIPVDLDATGATLQTPPAPRKVTIRVAETKWKEIETQLKGQPAKLKTKPVDLSKRLSGEDIQVEADISPFIEGVEVAPVTESVTFTVRIISPLVKNPTVVRLSVRTACIGYAILPKNLRYLSGSSFYVRPSPCALRNAVRCSRRKRPERSSPKKKTN